MSWKVRLIALDHMRIYSIYRFSTRVEAERYLIWLYPNEPKHRDEDVEESDESANVELDENMVWKWRMK